MTIRTGVIAGALAASIGISAPAPASEEFPTPRQGSVISYQQVAKEYLNVRMDMHVTKLDGDRINFQIDSSIPSTNDKLSGTATYRFLTQEVAANSTGVQECEFTRGFSELGSLTIGKEIEYDMKCTHTSAGRVDIIVLRHTRRVILRNEDIVVKAGKFSTILVDEVTDLDFQKGGSLQAPKRQHEQYWFVRSLGFYVRKTAIDDKTSGTIPFTIEAVQIR